MLRRKILFWLVWIPAAPLVWMYYAMGRRSYQYYLTNLPATKTALVRQAVWDKMVLRKEQHRNREYYKRRL